MFVKLLLGGKVRTHIWYVYITTYLSNISCNILYVSIKPGHLVNPGEASRHEIVTLVVVRMYGNFVLGPSLIVPIRVPSESNLRRSKLTWFRFIVLPTLRK